MWAAVFVLSLSILEVKSQSCPNDIEVKGPLQWPKNRDKYCMVVVKVSKHSNSTLHVYSISYLADESRCRIYVDEIQCSCGKNSTCDLSKLVVHELINMKNRSEWNQGRKTTEKLFKTLYDPSRKKDDIFSEWKKYLTYGLGGFALFLLIVCFVVVIIIMCRFRRYHKKRMKSFKDTLDRMNAIDFLSSTPEKTKKAKTKMQAVDKYLKSWKKHVPWECGFEELKQTTEEINDKIKDRLYFCP